MSVIRSDLEKMAGLLSAISGAGPAVSGAGPAVSGAEPMNVDDTGFEERNDKKELCSCLHHLYICLYD